MRCPKCGSTNITLVSHTTQKGFSACNACCGMILFNVVIGLLCGLCGSGKTKTKEYWVCCNCGAHFSSAEAGVSEMFENILDNILKKNMERIVKKTPIYPIPGHPEFERDDGIVEDYNIAYKAGKDVCENIDELIDEYRNRSFNIESFGIYDYINVLLLIISLSGFILGAAALISLFTKNYSAMFIFLILSIIMIVLLVKIIINNGIDGYLKIIDSYSEKLSSIFIPNHKKDNFILYVEIKRQLKEYETVKKSISLLNEKGIAVIFDEDVQADAVVEAVSAALPVISLEKHQPESTEKKSCPECGAEVSDECAFCPKCGNKLPQKWVCSCGTENPEDALFCKKCGTKKE